MKTTRAPRLETDVRLSEWQGHRQQTGFKPPSIDLYRLSADGIAARSIFTRDDAVNVGEQAVTFTHLLGLRVEAQPDEDKKQPDVLVAYLGHVETEKRANRMEDGSIRVTRSGHMRSA